MRTTIHIDDELHRQVALKAVETRQTVSEVIEDAVRASLRPDADDAVVPPIPVFDGGGVRPGVDFTSNAALRDVMDEGVELDGLR